MAIDRRCPHRGPEFRASRGCPRFRDEVGPCGRTRSSAPIEEDRAMTTTTAAQVPREIVFHAYPRLIFAWPIILLGFLLYPLDA